MDREGLKARAATLAGHAEAVLLWGSHVRDEADARSDIDLCVVAGDRDLPGVLLRALRAFPAREHDVRLFEELPPHLQGAVLDRHEVLWAHDELDLYEYVYPFRKRWRDQERRQRIAAQGGIP